jgi:hypothetical protein
VSGRQWSASPNRNAGKLQLPPSSRFRCSGELAAAFLVNMILEQESSISANHVLSCSAPFVREVMFVSRKSSFCTCEFEDSVRLPLRNNQRNQVFCVRLQAVVALKRCIWTFAPATNKARCPGIRYLTVLSDLTNTTKTAGLDVPAYPHVIQTPLALGRVFRPYIFALQKDRGDYRMFGHRRKERIIAHGS